MMPSIQKRDIHLWESILPSITSAHSSSSSASQDEIITPTAKTTKKSQSKSKSVKQTQHQKTRFDLNHPLLPEGLLDQIYLLLPECSKPFCQKLHRENSHHSYKKRGVFIVEEEEDEGEENQKVENNMSKDNKKDEHLTMNDITTISRVAAVEPQQDSEHDHLIEPLSSTKSSTPTPQKNVKRKRKSPMKNSKNKNSRKNQIASVFNLTVNANSMGHPIGCHPLRCKFNPNCIRSLHLEKWVFLSSPHPSTEGAATATSIADDMDDDDLHHHHDNSDNEDNNSHDEKDQMHQRRRSHGGADKKKLSSAKSNTTKSSSKQDNDPFDTFLDLKGFKTRFAHILDLEPASSNNTNSTLPLPIGLKNLGATCYINVLIQNWFHIPLFKSMILSHNFPSSKFMDENEQKEESGLQQNQNTDGIMINLTTRAGIIPQNNDIVIDEETNLTLNVAHHLQIVFAFLEKSVKRYYSPLKFVEFLGLNSNVQQDAQEFSKLFQTLLDNCLGFPISKALFEGTLAYERTCFNCNSKVNSSSTITELMFGIPISGMTVQEGIQSVLAKEEIEGVTCGDCHQTTKSIRQAKIHSYPAILQIQLLRFQYNLNTEGRIKNNKAVDVPFYLRLPYIYEHRDVHTNTSDHPHSSIEYFLTAIIDHAGNSAESGHYTLRVFNHERQTWFLFDDDKVTEIEDWPRKLNDFYSFESQSSKSCYVLLYSRTIEQENKQNSSGTTGNHEENKQSNNNYIIPNMLKSQIEKMNTKFKLQLNEKNHLLELLENEFRRESSLRQCIHERGLLESCQDDFYYFDPAQLSKWADMKQFLIEEDKLSSPSSPVVGPSATSTSHLICPHGKIDPVVVSETKRLRKSTVDELLLTQCSLPKPIATRNEGKCVACVKFYLKEKYKEEDRKSILVVLKERLSDPENDENNLEYLISKLFLKHLVATNHCVEEDLAVYDIRCPHGRVSNSEDETVFRAITSSMASLIQAYYELIISDTEPETRTKEQKKYMFHINLLSCEECDKTMTLKKAQVDSDIDQAHHERSLLLKLYKNKQFTPIIDLSDSVDHHHQMIVSSVGFLNEWRKYIGFPKTYKRCKDIDNRNLFCEEHDKLIFDPEVDHGSGTFEFASLETWECLLSLYPCPKPIHFFNRDSNLPSDKSPNRDSVCTECRKTRLLSYEKTTVRLEFIDVKSTRSEPNELSKYQNKTIMKVEDNYNVELKNEDPNGIKIVDEVYRPRSTRRIKNVAIPGGSSSSSSSYSTRSKTQTTLPYARSLLVYKDDTIKDIRVRIMKKFKISPILQTIEYNHRKIENLDTTVEELEVLPDSLLIVHIHPENQSSSSDTVDLTIKEGFKGSILYQ